MIPQVESVLSETWRFVEFSIFYLINNIITCVRSQSAAIHLVWWFEKEDRVESWDISCDMRGEYLNVKGIILKVECSLWPRNNNALHYLYLKWLLSLKFILRSWVCFVGWREIWMTVIKELVLHYNILRFSRGAAVYWTNQFLQSAPTINSEYHLLLYKEALVTGNHSY